VKGDRGGLYDKRHTQFLNRGNRVTNRRVGGKKLQNDKVGKHRPGPCGFGGGGIRLTIIKGGREQKVWGKGVPDLVKKKNGRITFMGSY